MRALAEARVLAARRYAPELVELTLEAVGEPAPGQFYQLFPDPAAEAWLGRPMSYFRRGRGYQSFYFRVVGAGTARLAALRPGEAVAVLGPLGRGFPLDRPGPHLLLGGGTGIPTLWDLARALGSRGEAVTVVLGGRRAADVAVARAFAEVGEVVVVTEDGTAGRPGVVTDDLPPARTIYACGPEGMLAAVRRHALETGVEAYLALETTMACGFGACLGCAVPRAAASGSRRYLRLCVEGPVLECREVAP